MVKLMVDDGDEFGQWCDFVICDGLQKVSAPNFPLNRASDV